MIKVRYSFAALLVATFITLFQSCDKKVGKIIVAKTIDCDSISFQKHIRPIVNNNCVSCHNSSFSGADYTKYEDLKSKALNGTLKARVIDGIPAIMPKGGQKLPQPQLDLIQCWIDNGAKP